MSSVGTSRRRGGRARTDLPMNADINVTSLVDVAFTLLVIFIITAPILQGGLEVDLPRADIRPLTTEEGTFYVTFTRNGEVFLEDTQVAIEDLETTISQLVAGGAIERILIQGDSLAPYGPVLRTFATAIEGGVRVAFVGEPYVEPS